MPLSKPLEQRFWAKVDKTADSDGCWSWTGCRWSGYGRISEGGKYGKPLIAHRVSYELKNGEIPQGAEIHHKCHNKSCVNPDHLELVASHAEHGLLHKKLPEPERLDWDSILAGLPWEMFDDEMIRKMVLDGVPQVAIARRLGLSKQRIFQIKSRQRQSRNGR